MRVIKPSVEILDMADYEFILKKLERAGRVCYKSENLIKDESAEKFLRGILRRGHESVIEHEHITIVVTCDRGITHEIVRHRLASYSQESSRYCNYANDKFGNEITVIDLATGFKYDLTNPIDKAKYECWQDAMRYAEAKYMLMLDLGAKPEEARSVLPNSLKTEIVMTMNLREWRHFFRMRCHMTAHPQMREVANEILRVFKEKLPVFFEEFEYED